MSRRSLAGVIAAVPTPIDSAGDPDLDRFLRLARHLLDNGCDGLNVCGTTGEATSLSLEQRLTVMRGAAGALPKERLMVGTGAAAVADAETLTRAAADLGFAGALLLPPFYYKGVGAEGVLAYLERVAAATVDNPIPLYLYHFPALSGVPYTTEIVEAALRRIPDRLAGLKDSSGDLAYARSVAALSTEFDVFPSNEAVLCEARGGAFAGCISATANLNSRLCARAFRLDDREALERAVAIRKTVSAGPLIPGIKAAVAAMLGDAAYSTTLPPLEPLSEGAATQLWAELHHILGPENVPA